MIFIYNIDLCYDIIAVKIYDISLCTLWYYANLWHNFHYNLQNTVVFIKSYVTLCYKVISITIYTNIISFMILL